MALAFNPNWLDLLQYPFIFGSRKKGKVIDIIS